MSTTDVRDYYRTITEQDISAVARELLGTRVMEEKGTLMECDCPHHQSISRRSLHINADRQAWYCFGCGVGGDILQLVKFVQSGQVTASRASTRWADQVS